MEINIDGGMGKIRIRLYEKVIRTHPINYLPKNTLN